MARPSPALLAAFAFNRRTLFPAAPLLTTAPAILSFGCGKGPGELNLLMWLDEFQDPVPPNFSRQAARQTFAQAYPDNAIESPWWRPPEPSWYAAARNEFAEKFRSAA